MGYFDLNCSPHHPTEMCIFRPVRTSFELTINSNIYRLNEFIVVRICCVCSSRYTYIFVSAIPRCPLLLSSPSPSASSSISSPSPHRCCQSCLCCAPQNANWWNEMDMFWGIHIYTVFAFMFENILFICAWQIIIHAWLKRTEQLLLKIRMCEFLHMCLHISHCMAFIDTLTHAHPTMLTLSFCTANSVLHVNFRSHCVRVSMSILLCVCFCAWPMYCRAKRL